jgi:hypothetical protein
VTLRLTATRATSGRRTKGFANLKAGEEAALRALMTCGPGQKFMITASLFANAYAISVGAQVAKPRSCDSPCESPRVNFCGNAAGLNDARDLCKQIAVGPDGRTSCPELLRHPRLPDLEWPGMPKCVHRSFRFVLSQMVAWQRSAGANREQNGQNKMQYRVARRKEQLIESTSCYVWACLGRKRPRR